MESRWIATALVLWLLQNYLSPPAYSDDRSLAARQRISKLSTEAERWRARQRPEEQLLGIERAHLLSKELLGTDDWQTRYLLQRVEELRAIRDFDAAGKAKLEDLRIEAAIGNRFESEVKLTELMASRRRALGMAKDLLGEDSRPFANASLAYALALFMAGKLDEAELTVDAASNIIERLGGRDQPDFIEAMNLKAKVLSARGASQKASEVLGMAVKLHNRMEGLESPSLQPMRLHHASHLLSSGHYQAASELYVELLKSNDSLPQVQREANCLILAGTYLQHRQDDVATSLIDLARLQRVGDTWSDPELSRFEIRLQAELCLRRGAIDEALKQYQAQPGLMELTTASSATYRLVYAEMLFNSNDGIGATREVDKVLGCLTELEGRHPWESLKVRIDALEVLIRMQQYKKAEPLLREALPQVAAMTKEPSLPLARIEGMLAQIAEQQDDLDGALARSAECIRVHRELGGQTTAFLDAYTTHARLLRLAGNQIEADKIDKLISQCQQAFAQQLLSSQVVLKEIIRSDR